MTDANYKGQDALLKDVFAIIDNNMSDDIKADKMKNDIVRELNKLSDKGDTE
jgi:hypothetical protein